MTIFYTPRLLRGNISTVCLKGRTNNVLLFGVVVFACVCVKCITFRQMRRQRLQIALNMQAGDCHTKSTLTSKQRRHRLIFVADSTKKKCSTSVSNTKRKYHEKNSICNRPNGIIVHVYMLQHVVDEKQNLLELLLVLLLLLVFSFTACTQRVCLKVCYQ